MKKVCLDCGEMFEGMYLDEKMDSLTKQVRRMKSKMKGDYY